MSGKDSSFWGTRSSEARQLQLPPGKIRSGAQSGALYAYPREKSIRRFMDQVRQLTKRRVPLTTKELIEELNPVLRGWGHYYKRAHVRKLFNRLDALDRAAHLVASIPAVAERRLATAAGIHAVWTSGCICAKTYGLSK